MKRYFTPATVSASMFAVLLLGVTGLSLVNWWFKPSVPEVFVTPTVTLPQEVKTIVGVPVKIVAKTTGGSTVRWAVCSPACTIFAYPDHALVSSATSGRFVILAWNASGSVPSEATRCVLVVGDGKPVPPDPDPKPPDPVDPFVKLIQSAYDSDPVMVLVDGVSMNKATAKQRLAGIYRESASTVKKSALPTCKAFYDVMHQSRLSLIGDSLPATRAVLTIEMDRTLPRSTSAPLDATNRAACYAAFTKIADALEELK